MKFLKKYNLFLLLSIVIISIILEFSQATYVSTEIICVMLCRHLFAGLFIWLLALFLDYHVLVNAARGAYLFGIILVFLLWTPLEEAAYLEIAGMHFPVTSVAMFLMSIYIARIVAYDYDTLVPRYRVFRKVLFVGIGTAVLVIAAGDIRNALLGITIVLLVAQKWIYPSRVLSVLMVLTSMAFVICSYVISPIQITGVRVIATLFVLMILFVTGVITVKLITKTDVFGAVMIVAIGCKIALQVMSSEFSIFTALPEIIIIISVANMAERKLRNEKN